MNNSTGWYCLWIPVPDVIVYEYQYRMVLFMNTSTGCYCFWISVPDVFVYKYQYRILLFMNTSTGCYCLWIPVPFVIVYVYLENMEREWQKPVITSVEEDGLTYSKDIGWPRGWANTPTTTFYRGVKRPRGWTKSFYRSVKRPRGWEDIFEGYWVTEGVG